MEINNENYMQIIGNYGWICPICKRVLSPSVIECPHHNNSDWTLTSTTITTDKQNNNIKKEIINNE